MATRNSPIAVLGMGGTIDKDYPRTTKGYAFEIDEPAAERILTGLIFPGIAYRVQSICRKDSTEIVENDRNALVDAIRVADEARLVITHGTDTLIETAQYVAKSGVATGKTIAFTGAMKPERFKDSDASFNLGTAIGATAALPAGSVVVAMGGRIIDSMRCFRDTETGLFEERASVAKADAQGSCQE